MAKTTMRNVDLEPIDRLEEKVKALVSALERLRAEQAHIAAERDRFASEVQSLRAKVGEADGAHAEINALRTEREQIRSRVAGMLEKLDGLSLSEA